MWVHNTLTIAQYKASTVWPIDTDAYTMSQCDLTGWNSKQTSPTMPLCNSLKTTVIKDTHTQTDIPVSGPGSRGYKMGVYYLISSLLSYKSNCNHWKCRAVKSIRKVHCRLLLLMPLSLYKVLSKNHHCLLEIIHHAGCWSTHWYNVVIVTIQCLRFRKSLYRDMT